MNKNIIKIGDIVDVYFEYSDAIFKAEVIEKPHATGDCWKLKTKDNLYNVQNYTVMIKSLKE